MPHEVVHELGGDVLNSSPGFLLTASRQKVLPWTSGMMISSLLFIGLR